MMTASQPSYDELARRCQAAEAQLAAMQSSEIASVLESMSDAFFTLDDDLIVTYFNGAAARVLGRNAAEVLGTPLFDAFPEARGSIFEDRYREAILTKRPLHFETYFDAPPYRNWYEVRVYPHTQGIAVYFLVTTERKQTEQALRENEARLRLALASGHMGMWEWDIVAHRSIWNPGEYALFGLPVGDGQVDTDLFFQHLHPDDAEAFQLSLEAVMAGGTEWTQECRIIRADGEIRWLAGTGQLFRDGDGTPLRMIGINYDVTGHKEVETTQAFLLQCGLPGTGEDFFVSLARYLAETLHIGYVCIDQLVGDGLTAHTVAIYHDGHFDSNITYALKDTTCGKVIGETICCFPREVCQLFPDDADLHALQAESYIGTTLWDSQGQPIGLIALIDRQPLVQPQRAAALLQLVAPRTAAELERRQTEQALRESEDRFRVLTTLAPVGIYLTSPDGGKASPSRHLDLAAHYCFADGHLSKYERNTSAT